MCNILPESDSLVQPKPLFLTLLPPPVVHRISSRYAKPFVYTAHRIRNSSCEDDDDTAGEYTVCRKIMNMNSEFENLNAIGWCCSGSEQKRRELICWFGISKEQRIEMINFAFHCFTIFGSTKIKRRTKTKKTKTKKTTNRLTHNRDWRCFVLGFSSCKRRRKVHRSHSTVTGA